MKDQRRLGTLLLALAFAGCIGTAETKSADQDRAGNSSERVETMSQVIEMNGSKVAEITDKGEVWVGGNKAGEITNDGEIWVAGNKEGDLTKDGEVWKAGNKIGEITSKGAVWLEGNEVGTVESDGTIWVGSSRDGSFTGGDSGHAAIIIFYGFFELED